MNKKCTLFVWVWLSMSIVASEGPPWFLPNGKIEESITAINNKTFDINMYNKFGLTGLMVAADKGDEPMARLLVTAGAQVNAQSRDLFGNTPLHLALSDMNDANNKARISLVEFLLQSGADPHARNMKGQTPLHCLTTIDKPEHIGIPLTILLSFGALLNAQDNRGNTFLHNLVELRNNDMIAQLRIHYEFLLRTDMKNKDGLSAVEWSKRIQCERCTLALTDPAHTYQVPLVVQTYDINGLTRLMGAALCNNKQDAQKYIVVDKGDINQLSNNGLNYTALHYAVAGGFKEMANSLMDQSADLSIKNKYGITPAHLWILLHPNELDFFMDMIKKYPESLNIQDEKGNTILHTLVYKKMKNALHFIGQLYAGTIDLSLRNNESKTALELAEMLKETELVDSLMLIINSQKINN